MANRLLIALICALTPLISHAEESPRESLLLDKGWGIKPITSAKRDAPLTPVSLPHTWNAAYLPGSTAYNREMMVYKRKLEVTPQMRGKRLFLRFEGINSAADVFVNYMTAARHLGGYTAFCAEITDKVRAGTNDIEVWASNAYRTDVLPISGDFNVYGGIHRPCRLVITAQNCISPLFFGSSGVFIHQDKVSEAEAELTVETVLSLRKPDAELTLRATITDPSGHEVAQVSAPVSAERVRQQVSIKSPELWEGKANPALYTVKVELYEGSKLLDRVTERTGLRHISADADRGFLLNGRPYDLHGFCRHEDVAGKGSALTPRDYETDMALILVSGATAMRLAHYPHAETMYELADKEGIILWTEIPLAGSGGYAYTGFVGNEGLKENARQVLQELVYQNFNHPSVCFWGVFNELLLTDNKRFQAYDDPVPFVKELGQLYKKLDSSKLTTFATCVNQTRYLDCADLIAWNKYFSWNRGGTDWRLHG